MFRSLHTAATGMAAQEAQLDAISNNIANSNTVGYKAVQPDFEDLLYQTVSAPGTQTSSSSTLPTGLQIGSGVRMNATARTNSQGTLQVTNNPLDVAIQGNGFFVVTQGDGTLAYTRAGSLKTDAQGRIVTPQGLPIDPQITVPANATNITIGADGTVSATVPSSATPTQLGQIRLANFVNPQGLSNAGQNLLLATAGSGEAQVSAPGVNGVGALQQGSIEGSNVNVVNEMIGLIAAQRAYEMNSKVISAANEMLQSATQMR